MKVICWDAYWSKGKLSFDKEYEVIKEDEDCYYIINDLNCYDKFYKTRFLKPKRVI